MVEPKNQGRGFMSMTIDEALAYSPNDTFGLVTTVEKARDQCMRFGFEVVSSFPGGKGRVACDGLPPAPGVQCYSGLLLRLLYNLFG